MSGAATRDPGAAVAALRSARRVLVTSHMSPDGDAIGSELALAELAERLGATVTVVNRDRPPSGLDELPGCERIVVVHRLARERIEEHDLAVLLECPGLDRPGLDGLDAVPILNVDHHRGNELYGAVNYVDEEAPAVGEMVWRMFRAAGVGPSPEAATCAYAALATDTGDFRYANATPRAFAAAAEMVAAGARPERVAELVHERRSEGSIRLLGEALATLELHAGGKVAVMWVDAEAFRRAGARPEDTEDLVNAPRAIAGVRAVAFLKQWEPGVVRVSLRSKGSVDVQAVAASFGGGGHTNAAGCTIRDGLEAARAAVVARLTAAVEGAR